MVVGGSQLLSDQAIKDILLNIKRRWPHRGCEPFHRPLLVFLLPVLPQSQIWKPDRLKSFPLVAV